MFDIESSKTTLTVKTRSVMYEGHDSDYNNPEVSEYGRNITVVFSCGSDPSKIEESTVLEFCVHNQLMDEGPKCEFILHPTQLEMLLEKKKQFVIAAKALAKDPE